MFIFTAMIDGDQTQGENIDLELQLQQGMIINLRASNSSETILEMRQKIKQITADYRGFVPGFVNEVMSRIPDTASAIYSAVIFQPELTVQLLSYYWENERYFKAGVNGLAVELSRSQLLDAGSLNRVEGFKTFGAILPEGNPIGGSADSVFSKSNEISPLEIIEHDLMTGIQNMENYLRAKRMDEYTLIKIGTGKLMKLFGITSSSQTRV